MEARRVLILLGAKPLGWQFNAMTIMIYRESREIDQSIKGGMIMQDAKLNVTTEDGRTINAKVFTSEKSPKGILIVCHGFGEHIERYREFARYLTDSDYICVIFDQRGHGEKCNKKTFGITTGYESFLDDLEVIKSEVTSRYSELPLIIYGHSMGGNIAVNYLLNRGQENFAGAVLETPWLRLNTPVKPPLVALTRILGKINYKWAIVKKLNIDDISSDKKRNAEVRSDKLYHNRMSFRMFAGISDAGENAIQNAANLKIPVMLVCAGEDKIVCSKAINDFAENANANVVLTTYEEAYHCIHNGVEKENYFQDLIEFLNSICRKFTFVDELYK